MTRDELIARLSGYEWSDFECKKAKRDVLGKFGVQQANRLQTGPGIRLGLGWDQAGTKWGQCHQTKSV